MLEVSKFTNSPEILEGRVKTLHPKIHAGILNKRKSKTHLRDIKNKETGQTAYDRMRELVGTVKIRYEDGKEYTLKEIVEKLVMDKKSQLYRLPDNKVLGEDMRQNLILNYVNESLKIFA